MSEEFQDKTISRHAAYEEVKTTLSDYWSGRMKPLKTTIPYLDHNLLGGMRWGSIGMILALSGHGKTHLKEQLLADLTNPTLNPGCEKYVIFDANWEMLVLNLAIRRAAIELNIKRRSIWNGDLSDAQKKAIFDIIDREQKKAGWYQQESLAAEDWYRQVRQKLINLEEGQQLINIIDHIALVKDNGDKKQMMDLLVERSKDLKLEFPTKIITIILSQLNRKIEERTDPRYLAPQKGDVYGSDTMYQICDWVLALHQPWKLNHDKYMVLPGPLNGENRNSDQYEHLIEHMTDPTLKLTNLETYGRLYYHYLKIREEEDSVTIACEVILPALKEELRQNRQVPQHQSQSRDIAALKAKAMAKYGEDGVDIFD